jgi:hypothetical protein
MTITIPIVEACVATVNLASELTFGRITHGAEMSGNFRVSKASKEACVNVALCGWDIRTKSVTKEP